MYNNNQVDYAAVDQPFQVDDDCYKRADDEANEQLCGGITKFGCYKMSWCLVQLVALIMAILNINACLHMMDNDYSDNTTIYTQAIQDWTSQPWVDFQWVADKQECPQGYETIGIDWLGTHRGNVTNRVIVVDDESRYRHDINPLPKVKQTSLYEDMKDGLCGKRGGSDHTLAVRAKVDDSGEGYCPQQGQYLCTKDNPTASGFATCVESKDECPITEVMIYTDAERPDKIDNRFTVKASSGTGVHKLNLAFTKEAVTTHTAVQQIGWQLGQPCAFTDQSPVTSADQTPRYYTLERTGFKADCQEFIFEYEDGSVVNQIAADDRYINQGKMSDLPNMATVQELSGVKEQLSVMPFFYRDLGTGVWDRRSKFKYNFWTRSTIEYDYERCDISQRDALIFLQDMQHASSKTNLTIGVVAASIVYISITTIIGCCTCHELFVRDEYEPKLNSRSDNATIATGVMASLGFINLIVAAINFKRIFAETAAMTNWMQVDGCVSKPYMTLSEHESISVSTIDTYARKSLALSVLIPIVQLIMVMTGCFYNSRPRK